MPMHLLSIQSNPVALRAESSGFMGFMMQAEDESGNKLGHFVLR
jgi:hypothetical protein